MNRKERRAANKRYDEPARRANPIAFAPAVVSMADLAVQASRSYGEGRFSDAQDICRRILARDPAHVQSLNLLGLMAQASGDHRGALKLFAKAIASDEMNAACHYNAGNSYQALGSRAKAAAHFSEALALGMDKIAVTFILQSPAIATYLARIADKWPLPVATSELFGVEGLTSLAEDLLLRCAMEATMLPGVNLERLLGYARAALLHRAAAQTENGGEIDDDVIAFACALARQCFINEYVYSVAEEECKLAGGLRNRLLQDLTRPVAISPLTLAIVAAYFPLHAIPMADVLLSRDWSASIAGLLRVQLGEPLQELADRAAIPALAPVKDSVSLQVMRQYEENPYPRWTINPLNVFAADQARGTTNPPAERQAKLDILIAGCGTGLHAVQVAQVYPNARVLAVDISMSSLAYARRRTRELGLHNIEYAQADILELGTLHRTFDIIHSVGVLHHLAEPMAGWRVLISLLRPGGRMCIGLYSELARRAVVEVRDHIVARGYRATAGDIRRCRQDIIGNADRWKMLTAERDFYSMSGCRDLLFNVMEHRFTIPRIAAFLKEQDLCFLAFEPFDDPAVIEKFHKQFADAADEASLDQWHLFETDHPETFLGMYIFTVSKRISASDARAV